ncbi:hypothetical protein [Glutamicibacter sp. NPDC087344]|uniref:hypothetical protein n=1 Tax=Glutamicibacter sp. NPDC087344 TaxID=3363994 RepID=UPI00382DE48B
MAINVPLEPEFEKLLTVPLTAALTALYYVLGRLFDTYIRPKLGWLHGLAKSPDSYSKDKPSSHIGD